MSHISLIPNQIAKPVKDDLSFFDDLDKAIIPPYWIVAGCVIVVGAVTIISSFRQLVAKVQTQQDEEVDVRKEDPWRNTPMILYFLVVMGIFLCACCMDTIFSSYLYIYATCR